jgi:deoxycytidylate deaminase
MSSQRQLNYNEAKLQACKSTMDTQYGCIITYRGKVISRGYNYLHEIGKRKSCLLCSLQV